MQSPTIAIAAGEPDWWAFMDLGEHIGKQAELHYAMMEAGAHGLEQIKTSDALPYADTLYQEPGRPQFHFSQIQGWNNDVNGLTYHDGHPP